MKNIVLLMILIAALVAAGCKDKHCPAFPEQLIDYFPYRAGDVLKFTNDNNGILTMKVESDFTSGETSYGCGSKCACGFEHSFKTEQGESILPIEGRIYGGNNYAEIVCCFGSWYSDDCFWFSKQNINPFAPENSNLFGDTVTLENAKATEINNVIIIKGEGVIEFFDIKNNCIWKKVNE